MGARMSAEVAADLTDWPRVVGEIIQQKFFPWPPTRWETISEMQQRDFRECADEIMTELRNRGWTPPTGWRPQREGYPR